MYGKTQRMNVKILFEAHALLRIMVARENT